MGLQPPKNLRTLATKMFRVKNELNQYITEDTLN